MTKCRQPGLLFFLCGMDQLETRLRRSNGITECVLESPTRCQGIAKQISTLWSNVRQKGAFTALNWTKCEMLPHFSLFTMSYLALLPLICQVLAPEGLCREPALETDVAEN